MKKRGVAHCYRRLDTRYFETTGNKIGALGIELLDTENCESESEKLENSVKPFEPMTY